MQQETVAEKVDISIVNCHTILDKAVKIYLCLPAHCNKNADAGTV
jgi:hypothetical protein